MTIGGSQWDLTYAFNYKTHVKLQTGQARLAAYATWLSSRFYQLQLRCRSEPAQSH